MLFPVAALYYRRNYLGYLKPVKLYVILALILNVLAVAMDKRLGDFTGSEWLMNNNYVYNIHSIVRFLCFCAFFERLKQPFLINLKRILPYVTAFLVILNFKFNESFFHAPTISSNLFALEAGVLLFYCLQYYLFKLQEDSFSSRTSDFWITTGLSIYVVFNFPFFLMYTSLSSDNQKFWWNIHNISYVIFCIFIAKAFYVPENER